MVPHLLMEEAHMDQEALYRLLEHLLEALVEADLLNLDLLIVTISRELTTPRDKVI